jgi:hypothetical protein
LAELAPVVLIFDLADDRGISPHDRVVGKIARRAALAVVSVRLAVDVA